MQYKLQFKSRTNPQDNRPIVEESFQGRETFDPLSRNRNRSRNPSPSWWIFSLYARRLLLMPLATGNAFLAKLHLSCCQETFEPTIQLTRSRDKWKIQGTRDLKTWKVSRLSQQWKPSASSGHQWNIEFVEYWESCIYT